MKDSFPSTPAHHLFIDHMESVLKNEEKLSRQDVAEQVEEESEDGLKESTMLSWLSTHRQEIEGEGFTSNEEADGTSGNPTVYWRLK